MLGRAKAAISLGSLLFGIMGVISLIWLNQFHYRLSQAGEISFKRTHFLTAALLIGALVCGVAALCMARRDSSIMSKSGAWGGVALSLIGLVLFNFDFGGVGVHSTPSALNVCINNQRSIDAAKERWVMHTSASNGTVINWNQIAADFPRGLPQCPLGGKYDLGKVGEPVTCSIPEHRTGVR
jgi:hypothetical protein